MASNKSQKKGPKKGQKKGPKKGQKKSQKKSQRKSQKKSQKVSQSPIIIGKIYSNGCIHCIHLEPIWDEMEKELSKQHSHFMFKKIEQTNEELETAEINNTYLQNAPNKLELQGGYPTIFKIVNGKVFYYNGDRSVPGLMEWSMKKGQ